MAYYRIVKGNMIDALSGHGNEVGVAPDLTVARMQINTDMATHELDFISLHTTSEGGQITRALDSDDDVQVYYHTMVTEGDIDDYN